MFKKRILSLLLIATLLTPTAYATSYDADELIYEIYTHTVNNETDFTIDYVGSFESLSDAKDIVKMGISFDEYLYYSLGEYEFLTTERASGTAIRIQMKRNSSFESEIFVNQYVEDTLKKLKLEGLSDYWRARKITEHLSEQFAYDYEDKTYDPYTLIQTKKGLCQAYALLFYKMARAAGLEVRHQEGSIDGGSHLWNVVKIKDQWFHVDATNTDFSKSFSLFLKSNDFMKRKGFNWTSLVEPVVETDENPNQYYISGNYNEYEIAAILNSKSPIYDKPDDSIPDMKYIESLHLYRTSLSLALDNFEKSPSKNSFTTLAQLHQTAFTPNGILETKALNAMNVARKTNRLQIDKLYLPYAIAVQNANKKPSVQTVQAAIKLGNEIPAKLKAVALTETDVEGYLELIKKSNDLLNKTLNVLKTSKKK